VRSCSSRCGSGARGHGVSARIQAWIDKVERAEAASIDGLNALEAHAWLDGPLAKDGRVTGAVRELFLDMNELALRAEQRGSEIPPPPAYERVRDIDVPALVLWGELDFPHVARVCEHLQAQIPNATAQHLRHAAHLPNLEHPAEFNRILLKFLDDIAR
jgi:pimeloyl-ACP methyl ester carboxylesterase